MKRALTIVLTGVVAGLAIAGCASSSSQRLRPAAEAQLLGLVAQARSAATARNATGVQVALGEFVDVVDALRASGAVTEPTAQNLDGQAQAAEREAVAELSSAASSRRATTTSTQTTSSATQTVGPVQPAPGPAAPAAPHGGPPRQAPPGHGGAPPGHAGKPPHGPHAQAGAANS
jgi:hypothetical protein